MQRRSALKSLAVGFILLGLSAGTLQAGPRSSAKVTQIPKAAGATPSAAIDKRMPAVKEENRINFSSTKGFEAKVSSGYRMDGSKQDKAYDLISLPLGRASDSLPVTAEPTK